MMLLRSALLSALTLPCLVLSQTQVTPLGNSAKFRISSADGDGDENKVTCEADFVEEIVSSGSTQHKTPTLANQDFSFSGPVSETIGDGVQASRYTFTANLTENGGGITYGTMALNTYIIEGDGTVSTATEDFEVKAGDIKFNIDLTAWTFDTNSEYVDVGVIVKGKNDEIEEKAENTYDLGGNVPLILSGRVVVDGTDVEMPSGYPDVQQNGNKYTFVFRIPKFTSSATYDPTIGFADAGGCQFRSDPCSSFIQGAVSRVGSFLRGTSALFGGP